MAGTGSATSATPISSTTVGSVGSPATGPESHGSPQTPARSATAPSTVAGDFYVPPSPLPNAPAGRLIRAWEVPSSVGRAWRILYHSRSLTGADIAVSGLFVRPAGPPPSGGFPVVAWAHGTTGLADGCAPSKSGPGWVSQELVRRGDAVAITDYDGLGTPGLHHFGVGLELGRSVLDAIRASRQLDAGTRDGPVVIAGWSEGGDAALWADQIAGAYSPDVAVAGVVAFAPAANLATVIASQNGGPFAGYAVTALVGLADAYPQAGLDAVLSPAAGRRLDAVRTTCAPAVVSAFANSAVVHVAGLRTPPWSTVLAENTPQPASGTAPILILHGDKDQVVPPSSVVALLGGWCRSGARVQLRRIPQAGHETVLQQANASFLSWLDDRLALRPVVGSSCG